MLKYYLTASSPECDDSQHPVLREFACMAVQANPFGSAKPRESVLATRSGKSEQEILAEEAKKGLKVCVVAVVHHWTVRHDTCTE